MNEQSVTRQTFDEVMVPVFSPAPFVPAEEDLPAVVRGVDPNYSGLFAPAQPSGEACFG